MLQGAIPDSDGLKKGTGEADPTKGKQPLPACSTMLFDLDLSGEAREHGFPRARIDAEKGAVGC